LCFKQSLGDVPWGGTYDFSPDGESVVLRSEKGLQLLDAATGKIRVTLSSDGDYRNVAWTFSPDGSSAVLTREDGMLLLDAATGRTRVTLSNEPGFANVTYTQDGMRILAIRKSDVVRSGDRFQITTAAGNSELAVWDAASGQLILSLQTRGLRPSLASYGRFLVLGPWILEADDWRSNAADQAVPRANPAQSTAIADPALATPP